MKFPFKKKREELSLKRVSDPNAVKSNRLKLLVTIVNRHKTEYYLDLLQSFEINMQMTVLAEGTANESMLSLLGLSNNEKTVILSVMQENFVEDVMATLDEKFKIIKDGKGVAFTIPLSSVIGTLMYGFLSNNRNAVKSSEVK